MTTRSETRQGVRIAALTRIRNGPEGQPRWRVALSDLTVAVTETGAPGIVNIDSPANAGLVDVEFRNGKITRVSPAPETRTCRKCRLAIELIGGAWVVMGTGTTADGLSYCPPDPDHQGRLSVHVPYARKDGR
jgi:hypothetical protein